MRIGTPGFIEGRLTEAREARRIPSKSALARRLGVNASTVSRWEEGETSPPPELLNALADELGVRQEFFLRPSVTSATPVFWRSLSSTLVRDLAYQRSQMQWLQEISRIVQHYVDFPVVDIPDVMGRTHYSQLRDRDLEEIAAELRRHWGLGEGPVGNMVSIMERVGFVVSSIEMGTSKLDGLCSWSNEMRPYVLLATDKMSFARRQMDAAHEMAHAVLHKRVSEEELKADLKAIEAQAFRLASAFLMPSTSYPLEVRSPSLAALSALKSRWRVSIKAQIRRLVDLNLIPSDHAVHLYKLYSAKGWNREEPFDRDWELQQPRLLADSLELIVDSGTRSKADLLALEFTMTAGDVENLCNLAPGWFQREKAEIVKLRAEPRETGVVQNGTATVLPFRHR
jgi:Zn-dependent peptidase ImmA (M78 family)/transcriptional regulator with XRE-family HTH domain